MSDILYQAIYRSRGSSKGLFRSFPSGVAIHHLLGLPNHFRTELAIAKLLGMMHIGDAIVHGMGLR